MVVTCGNENFKLLTQISAKFPSFFSLAEKILFSEKIFHETFIRRFSFFFSFLFFSFLFCFCHLSCIYIYIYILYISKTIKQSKLFGQIFTDFLFWLFFQQSARTFFYWKRGYFDRL